MSFRMKKRVVIVAAVTLAAIMVAGCVLYPPEIRYKSYLTPNLETKDPAISIDDEAASSVYDIGGSSVIAHYMTDGELNALFPDFSNDGKYSTNPYTYGNWIDPDLGYTPNRFTVFEVSIINRNFAKMWLDPVEAVLITDTGEVLHSYTNTVAGARYGKSFENYYRSILGQSGNEYYRYEMRVGMARGKIYGLEEEVFRGDNYSGLITFDTLRPEVKRVRLVLQKVVYRFDAFNRPADFVDVAFNFDRKIDKQVVTAEMRKKELEREKVRIKTIGTPQLVNARTNDSPRSARAIQRVVEENFGPMEACFMDRYRKGSVDPGRLTVSFTIAPSGAVTAQNATDVTGINSENFMNCILGVISKLSFEKIVDMPDAGENIVKGPARPVNVSYTFDFNVYRVEAAAQGASETK